MFRIVLALALFSSASATLYSNNTEFQQNAFATFVSEFHKEYSNAEAEALAFDNFVDFLKLVDERNAAELAAGGDAVHGITSFADMSQEEFERMFLLAASGDDDDDDDFTAQLVEGLPPLEESTTQDWTGKYTTPVKDQGYCGSCWAHSVAEQLESDCMREHGTKYVLSPQQLTSCDTKDSGCNGGDMKRAYSWIESYGGLVKDSDYPYTSGRAGITGTCDKSKESNPVVTLTNYYQLRSESDMGSYVGKTGPLSIGVDASTWNSYTGGIMKSCGTRVDHAVQAVGINTGSGYWKVRNSWGTRWGESGFIRLSYGSNTCGITSEATYTKTKKV